MAGTHPGTTVDSGMESSYYEIFSRKFYFKMILSVQKIPYVKIMSQAPVCGHCCSSFSSFALTFSLPDSCLTVSFSP